MGRPNPSSLSLKSTAFAALTTILQIQPTTAWNADIHNQIGFMAESFLTPYTSHVLSRILAAEPQYGGSIGRAAAWADEFAHTDEGGYSFQWHWVDSADHPPEHCSVYYNRDCTRGGCVVSAIANQTVRLEECVDEVKRNGRLPGRRSSSESQSEYVDEDVDVGIECARALKWVVHFIGDIAQPLHASGDASGGNAYDVIFNGSETNLHSVWDGHIIYTLSNLTFPTPTTGFPNTTIAPFFTTLLSRIHADSFPEPVSTWTACTDPSTPLACGLAWARESNAWTCDYVYSQVINGTGVDLATSGYAEGAYPIVEVQVAKAAVRLGTWLNRVVEGRYEREREVVLRTNPSWVGGPNGGA
ncbi:hypothetical protein VTN00DRAFT_894 [Thermoascus crustaceus]|uniref:uncharacterized protein n=1 Tax=Thermoascus crustaceus TaxID=5088 RepID=UPI0037439011